MKNINKSSILRNTPSGWIAAICLLVFTVILFIVSNLLNPIDKDSITGYILFGLLSAVACFFLIRQNPGSIWYVPLIINLFMIIAAIVEPNFWKQPTESSGISMWIPICGGWVLTVIASLFGAIKGKKHITADENRIK